MIAGLFIMKLYHPILIISFVKMYNQNGEDGVLEQLLNELNIQC